MSDHGAQGAIVQQVNISAVDYNTALSNIERWIEKKERQYVCVAAVHLVMECQKDRNLLNGVNAAGMVVPDGMPLVWLLRLYGHKNVERVYGPAFMVKLCALAAQRDWGVFLLGGASGQSQEVARALLRQHPNLRIVGHRDTPSRPIPPHHNQKIIGEINNAHPKIVFVGLGCPHQELWMIENRKYLDAPVLIGVGAAFDFLSGRVRQAPAWIQNSGLEWLFRFLQEPKRLWYRYTAINATFIWLVLKELLCKKRSSTQAKCIRIRRTAAGR